MSIKRLRRTLRCYLKYGPRGCPHIERHSKRSKRAIRRQAERRLREGTPHQP